MFSSASRAACLPSAMSSPPSERRGSGAGAFVKVDFFGRFAVMVSFGIVDSCDGLFWHAWVTLNFSLS